MGLAKQANIHRVGRAWIDEFAHVNVRQQLLFVEEEWGHWQCLPIHPIEFRR